MLTHCIGEEERQMELNLNTYHPKGAEAGCRTCGRVFASDRAFDMHRTGNYEEGRKCSENPSEAGLEMDNKGRWRRPKYARSTS
jgi:hypothetical protein